MSPPKRTFPQNPQSLIWRGKLGGLGGRTGGYALSQAKFPVPSLIGCFSRASFSSSTLAVRLKIKQLLWKSPNSLLFPDVGKVPASGFLLLTSNQTTYGDGFEFCHNL